MIPFFILLCEFTVLEPSKTLFRLKAIRISITASKIRPGHTRQIGQLPSQQVELGVGLEPN